ncbi:DEAD/DEAH box helicase family protein [Brevibacillus dissolubilis]|uniref:DEAD/DEAH box helicase family protein n=1 Tax=Brevibacillus dissolubilis TaxID=1844116 RepID=UPI001116037F|nr:DEAD/DEAH box helicase family protein [Brevibacillus dissolubilis]
MTSVKLITERLLEELIPALQKATSVYFLTSFVMRSGVQLLAPHLKAVLDRGGEVKVLAGDYLYVTQPAGLQAMLDIDDRIEVRLWQSKGISFHPKAYLVQQDETEGVFIVGSSNMSRSALTYGVEWSLAVQAEAAPATFDEALHLFMEFFYHEQTIPVNPETVRIYQEKYDEHHQRYPQLIRNWTHNEEIDVMFERDADKEKAVTMTKETAAPYQLEITPRPAQGQALEELQKTVSEEYNKAMVVMATGLGKTYLAAFFARNYKRVLFVAHREELLIQASRSFGHVNPERTTGIYNGVSKETEADGIFASIYTLSLKRNLESFAPDAFDLIIIDEFHHAAAKTYQRVLKHFKPSFLLGITATPDRRDGKDIYAICDGNVAYQVTFIEAIQKGWLAPFRYYGIYDETDYSKIAWLGTRYDEEQLLAAQLQDDLAERIYLAWEKHRQTRTIAFCSSIRQANYLAEVFRQRGMKVISLHSKTQEISRPEAIRQLDRGELQVIFTVDLFNEGVDIPSVDTLLFVRPTESLTIFTQQVGRGLRLYPEKEYCTIIDLIGNYRNVDVKLQLFDTAVRTGKKEAAALPTVPEFCQVNMDVQAVNLLTELARKRQPRKEKLLSAYEEVKQELGRIPSYLEVHLHGRESSREYRQEFKSYVNFLAWADELTDEERDVLYQYEAWLQEVESTGMAKSYKMIVLLYMLERGVEKWLDPVAPEEVAPFFHTYLMEKEYRRRIDFSDKASQALWEYDAVAVSRLVAQMPMSKWSGSSKGLVEFGEGRFSIRLEQADSLAERVLIYRWTREICEYRLHEHFERKSQVIN